MSDRTHATATAIDPLQQHFLRAADKIGCNLCRDSLWSDSQCNWLGWAMVPQGQKVETVFAALPPWLYNGVAGVALFLARLSRRTQDREQKETMWGAIQTLRKAGKRQGAAAGVGYYTGLAGAGHVLMQLGKLLGEESLLNEGLSVLDAHCAPVAGDQNPDVMAGKAGLIPPLLDAALATKDLRWLERATDIGRQLLKARKAFGPYSAWETPGCPQPLTGYSHGAAGIALSFLELHAATGDPGWLETAHGGFEFERAAFNAQEDNWPDFRPDPANPNASAEARCAVAWCNGCVGIGLSRLRAMTLHPSDPQFLYEIDAAVRSTMKSLSVPRPQNAADFTYCHGIAGSAEFLLQAALQFGRTDLLEVVRNLAARAIDAYQQPGLPWPCGVPGAGECPSLMLGTSGIGYFFLRLSDPTETPSVLVPQPVMGVAA